MDKLGVEDARAQQQAELAEVDGELKRRSDGTKVASVDVTRLLERRQQLRAVLDPAAGPGSLPKDE